MLKENVVFTDGMSCHVMSSYIKPCHAIHVMLSCYVISSCHFMSLSCTYVGIERVIFNVILLCFSMVLYVNYYTLRTRPRGLDGYRSFLCSRSMNTGGSLP